jgi:hypothetical protein
MDPSSLKHCFLTWYDTERPLHEREEAARACVRELLPHLWLPSSLRAIDALKEEELVQGTWRELFEPTTQRMAEVEPEQLIPHARSVLRHWASLALRRTLDAELEPWPFEEATSWSHGNIGLEVRHLEALDFEERMAVLLTTCLDRIRAEDWRRLAPAEGERPAGPLDPETASRLLWPPKEGEDSEAPPWRVHQLRERRQRALARLLELADGEQG